MQGDAGEEDGVEGDLVEGFCVAGGEEVVASPAESRAVVHAEGSWEAPAWWMAPRVGKRDGRWHGSWHGLVWDVCTCHHVLLTLVDVVADDGEVRLDVDDGELCHRGRHRSGCPFAGGVRRRIILCFFF